GGVSVVGERGGSTRRGRRAARRVPGSRGDTRSAGGADGGHHARACSSCDARPGVRARLAPAPDQARWQPGPETPPGCGSTTAVRLRSVQWPWAQTVGDRWVDDPFLQDDLPRDRGRHRSAPNGGAGKRARETLARPAVDPAPTSPSARWTSVPSWMGEAASAPDAARTVITRTAAARYPTAELFISSRPFSRPPCHDPVSALGE